MTPESHSKSKMEIEQDLCGYSSSSSAQHDTAFEQIPVQVNIEVTRTVRNGRYMTACFRLKENGDVILDRTTHEFPQDKFDEAVRLLKQNLDEACDRQSM